MFLVSGFIRAWRSTWKDNKEGQKRQKLWRNRGRTRRKKSEPEMKRTRRNQLMNRVPKGAQWWLSDENAQGLFVDFDKGAKFPRTGSFVYSLKCGVSVLAPQQSPCVRSWKVCECSCFSWKHQKVNKSVSKSRFWRKTIMNFRIHN